MKLISLNHGMMAAVDDADFEWLSRWKWCARKSHHSWYAMRSTHMKGKKAKISMARQIMGFPVGRLVDHRSGVTLDNRRGNLRVCTNAQNQHNQRRLRSDNTSGFKGVTFWSRTGRWNAQIYVNKKRVNLGCFASAKDASLAYDAAAKCYFGEFAAPNVVLR